MSASPFLILTLRRTGGTSLMSFLSQVSPYPNIQHEPFNKERIWGGVTAAYKENEDLEAVKAAIVQGTSERPNIKHCFEFIPLQITGALIDHCRGAGYKIFLLTRRDEVSRIASLFLAMATGAWGSDQAAEIYPRILAGEVTPDRVDPKAMRRRMNQDMRLTGQVLAMLRHRGTPYDWLVFEELYKGETPIETQARAIAGSLGIAVADDDPSLSAFVRGGGQGSAQIAGHVKGIEAGKRILAKHWVI